MRLPNKQSKDNNDNKVKGRIKKQITAALVAVGIKLLPILLVAAIITSAINWVVKIFQPENTVTKVNEELEAEDMSDIIEIKGDSSTGYYLDFKNDVDEKLEKTIDFLDRSAGVKSGIKKEFLKKMIKAEVCTQFPNLGANVEEGQGFQGVVDILRITPNKRILELKNVGAGKETIKSEDLNKVEIINEDVIKKQEKVIKTWSTGKELTISAKTFVYEQEDSTLHKGEKIDYWLPQRDSGTKRNIEIKKGEIVTYTGKYSLSVDKYSNEGLIYVEIQKDKIKGYIKYNFIVNSSNEEESSTDDVVVDNGYSENIEEKVTDTIDSNVYKLTYIPKEEFDKKVESDDISVLKNFTIDDEKNLITATWSALKEGDKEEEIEIQTNSAINLKTALQNYIMPYEYLMFFYMEADYTGFSNELADKVLNSKIIIAVEDNVETIETVETVENKKDSSNSSRSYDWTKVSSSKTLSEYCSTNIELIYANTWCTKVVDTKIYKSDLLNIGVGQYQNIKMAGTVEENKYRVVSEETSTSGVDYESHTEYICDEDGKVIDTNTWVESIPYTLYEHTITDTHRMGNSYSNGDKDVSSKENVFVDLYKKHKMHNRVNEKRLFYIIEKNEKTANLLNLTKYLIYMSTNIDYGVKEYDFSEYETSSFINISGNYGDWDGTGTTQDFINAVAPYAVADMQEHDIYASVTIAQAIIESGWGKDSIAVKYKNFFGMKAKGEYSSGNEYWDGAGVALKASEGGISYFKVYDSLKNSVFDHGRNFHVTDTYKIHGVLECISKNLGPKEQLKRIALSGYAVNKDGSIAKPDGVRTYDVYLYQEIIQKYNLEVYDKMTVDDFESIEGNQEIVEIAKSKLGCPYVWGAKGPSAFDCSGLVYWVYGQKKITVPGSTDGYYSYRNRKEEISWSEAQPGDILIIFKSERTASCGHAGIYLGNDQYIHAPQSGDVVKISTGAKSKFKHVFRFSK